MSIKIQTLFYKKTYDYWKTQFIYVECILTYQKDGIMVININYFLYAYA